MCVEGSGAVVTAAEMSPDHSGVEVLAEAELPTRFGHFRAIAFTALQRDLDDADLSIPEIMLEDLDRRVGGRLQLMALDDHPLPDEAFEWAGIPENRPAVQDTLDACNRVAVELLDVEHRTAMRRLLGRAAVGDPAVFRCKASPVRGAAAVAWVICRANDTAGGYSSGLTVQELLAAFGVKGSMSQRAELLLRANGIDPHRLYGEMDLGAPDLPTGGCRTAIIQQQDRLLDRDQE